MKKFWNIERTREEEALAIAALRIRMATANQHSGSPNRLDYAAAAIIAETIEQFGFSIVAIPKVSGNTASCAPSYSTKDLMSVYADHSQIAENADGESA